MDLALSTTLHTTFDDALERTRDALAEQGFGILTEIDMQATLKAKLGHDMEDYRILGACNPPLAHQAVEINRQIGLLLPCNVVVRRDRTDTDTIIVEAMNPQLMVAVTGQPALDPVAEDATTRLRAALAALGPRGFDMTPTVPVYPGHCARLPRLPNEPIVPTALSRLSTTRITLARRSVRPPTTSHSGLRQA